MSHLFLLVASIGATHHHAPPVWTECTSRSGCHRYEMKREHRTPTGLWHACTSSPAVTVCISFPRFEAKPTHRAVVSRPAPIVRATVRRVDGPYRYETTGYAPGCGASGATASGVWPHPGTAAATLPFGTRGYVPGYGEFVVEDTGGAVGPGHLDLFFPSCGEAVFWGVRYLPVSIYR